MSLITMFIPLINLPPQSTIFTELCPLDELLLTLKLPDFAQAMICTV